MFEIDKMNMVTNKARNRSIGMTLRYTCKDCGKEVETSLGELLNLDDRGLCVSNRCKECREARKNAR